MGDDGEGWLGRRLSQRARQDRVSSEALADLASQSVALPVGEQIAATFVARRRESKSRLLDVGSVDSSSRTSPYGSRRPSADDRKSLAGSKNSSGRQSASKKKAWGEMATHLAVMQAQIDRLSMQRHLESQDISNELQAE